MISLTPEQKIAVNCLDDLALSACPGSGKTRVILAKLLRLADEVDKTPRSIGCITYTNAAVDEIEARLKRFGNQDLIERSEIATIHSFCLQFILRPYRWLVPEVPAGFRILTQQMGEFERLVETVEDEFGRRVERRTHDDYASTRMDVLGMPVGTGITNGVVTDASAFRYWELMRVRGFIDFSMILYYSLKILRENSYVGVGIASRFKWLLIDEYQDTTDIQLEIIRLLAQYKETGFFFVGDPNQSIQGFAGARTDLSEEFADEIGARKDLSLTGNYRSSSTIVELSERIIARMPPMTAVGRYRDYATDPIYIHADDPIEAITDYFLPTLGEHGIPLGKAAILAPWWQHLLPIARRLREFEIPVFGPGARPYKKTRLFAALAEQLGACAEADHLLGLPGVERAIFRLVSEVTGASRFDIFSYEGRRSALALVYKAKSIAREAAGGVDWLNQASVATSDILIKEGWLPSESRGLLEASVVDMVSDMKRNRVDVANLQISDLGLFANPDAAIKLTTLHQAKGREFDAVALVNMNEGQIPHFTSSRQFEFDEARRLFYVGVTRAKKVLLLSSDQSDYRNVPTRYLQECGLIA